MTTGNRTDGICCLFCLLVDAAKDPPALPGAGRAATAEAHFMAGGTTAISFLTVYGLESVVAAMCPPHHRYYRQTVDRAHLELNRDLS